MSYQPQKPPAATLHERAIQDAAEDAGGRWARNADVRITGTTPSWAAPAIGGQGPWATPDPVPPEEPINFEADSAVPDQTTISGIARELLEPAPEEDEQP
jgi:hypothetical protein